MEGVLPAFGNSSTLEFWSPCALRVTNATKKTEMLRNKGAVAGGGGVEAAEGHSSWFTKLEAVALFFLQITKGENGCHLYSSGLP